MSTGRGSWGKPLVIKKDEQKVEAPETFVEKRSGTQTREFDTLQGRGRSLSISQRHEQRINTVKTGTNTFTSGPWKHMGDTNRKHVHPGGGPHTPTVVPGAVGGSKTTPVQRQQLDALASTRKASSTKWNK